jgi:LTXXQ motif family protein
MHAVIHKAPRQQFEINGDWIMVSPTPAAPVQPGLRLALGAVIVTLLGIPQAAHAQGLVKGVQQGAEAGNKAAGPVGGVLGGAIGGVVGVFTGVLGVGEKGKAGPANDAKQTGPAKTAKSAKGAKTPPKPVVLTQPGEPELTAEQIVTNSDADIDRIKAELNLTPEQEKHWTAFNSAMHYLGHNGADRLNLRIARAKRDPPDDIVEQMRNEAQFLNDRAVDQRSVADAAEPLFTSLDDKQKAIFIQEMVRLSHERGLD